MKKTLQTEKPELAAEWHPSKNVDKKPSSVPPQSNENVWWLGSCGHEWKAKISNRYHGAGCPYCNGRYPIKGLTDLATTNPLLAQEWHPYKNGSLTPSDVKEHSNRKVWWICSQGHEWEAMINSRKRNGCPYCSGKAVLKGYNDLATTHPDLANEWHPSRNGDKTPYTVSSGHDAKVWWLCKYGHEWEAPIYNRIKGHGCPVCAKGQKTSFPEQAVYYYLQQLYPDAINTDNRYGFELDIFVPSINIAVEYDGYKWHSDFKQINKDISKNTYCSENKIHLYRFREDGCPEMKESNVLTIIHCKYNDFNRLQQAIKEFIRRLGKDMDVDLIRDRIPIQERYLSARRKQSLREVNPELASEWHPVKNGSLTPLSVNSGSEMKYWWLGKCGHEWEASVYNRMKGKGCPYCLGKAVLPGYNDLATTNPDVASEWHPTKNGNLKQTDITKNSNKKVWWICKKGHEWQAQICSRNKCGCPYCGGKKTLIGFNDLTVTNPELSSQWHPAHNVSLRPEMFTKGSNQKVWWICNKGHEWQATIKSRTRGRGCPICGRESAKAKLGRRIVCFETGMVFISSSEAASFCHGAGSNIIKCCQGKINSAYGYHWKYQ